jgi:glycosyltransferase involved in cell wall biosynthesis/ribosomal protein S18 acetylase RimI-like enzyme
MPKHVENSGLKILHIVGDSRYGGVVRIILGLAREAKAAGWQLDVLATDPAVQEALRRHSIGVVDLDVIRREIHPLRDLTGLLRLRHFLRHADYRIVHTHTSKGGFVGRLAARLAGVPIILHTMHGLAIHEQSPTWARVVYAALERLASRWCHRIVSVSRFHRDWALELKICPLWQIHAIPNGITPDPESAAMDRDELRATLGVGRNELLILSPTRLAWDKGLQHLIEAATLLPPDNPRCRIVIAGDGLARPRLEELARSCGVSDRVTFLGFREDVPDLLAAADVVVLPSLREGLSMSLLEAMAAKKPIITTSIGSNREVASQSEMALLVPPAQPAALAHAIQRLSHDPGLSTALAAGARSLFEAHYTEERMLDSYQELYLGLLEDQPARTRERSLRGTSIVRNATTGDLPGIVTIHQKAFQHFFLTQLGGAFLRRYYEHVLRYASGIVLVTESNGVLNGFACGFGNPAEFYRSMWRERFSFAFPALRALFRNPALGGHMINAVRRLQTSATQGPPSSCELSSIAVAPEASGRGLGKVLLRAFLERSWAKQALSVYLTTDAAGNDGANALYREIGFRRARCFQQQKGRWMNEYVFHREPGSELVEVHQ